MIRLVLRIVVAVLTLAFLASRVDLVAVRDALVATPLSAVASATAASFAANFVIAYRRRALLAAQGVAATVGQAFAVNLAAFFYNLLLPVGGVGVAIVRVQRLARHAPGRFTTALTALVCDRFAAFVALGAVGLACFVLDPHPKPPGALLVLLVGVASSASSSCRARCRPRRAASSATSRPATAAPGGRP